MGFTINPLMKTSCFLVLLLVGSAFAQDRPCPFNYLFHLGDGAFDTGNSILTKPFGRTLPVTRPPYGKTYPGYPNGRWSDGQLDIDIGATGMGFPVLTPYLNGNSSNNDAIIFAVARSPILDRDFFTQRGVKLEPFAAPLSTQMSWYKSHVESMCSTPTECADKLADSLFLLGDVEGNDATVPLTQGKSIEEVRSYVPYVTNAQINAAREVIKMGGSRVIIPGNNPMGCYPFILTQLGTNNPEDYDEFGCLKKVNELIQYKNSHLNESIANLAREFPDTLIFYADFYTAFRQLLGEVNAGSNKNTLLQSCCGAGGKYNYSKWRFCGSWFVGVCSNPKNYIYWDGIHLTEFANTRLSQILSEGAGSALNCTMPDSTAYNRIREVTDNKITLPRNLLIRM